MARAYSMRGVVGIAEQAVRVAKGHLLTRAPGCRVHDVQADPRFQHRGIDLLWELPGGELKGVEVKGDRHARRKTFFFELISNAEANTPGCFLYSEADVLVYVFLETLEVHHLPLPATRAWFLTCASAFPLKQSTTRAGRKGLYTTVGAAVPVREVLKAVPGSSKEPADPRWAR